MLNLKNLHDLQSKAREIQKQLDTETIEVENHGIKIIMNGKQEIISVTINSELSKDDQEKYLREAFNDGIKKIQSLMAKKMMGM